METPDVLDIDTARSYTTEARLMKALAPWQKYPFRIMVVRNRAGRFTAVFHLRQDEMSYAFNIALAGFKVF